MRRDTFLWRLLSKRARSCFQSYLGKSNTVVLAEVSLDVYFVVAYDEIRNGEKIKYCRVRAQIPNFWFGLKVLAFWQKWALNFGAKITKCKEIAGNSDIQIKVFRPDFSVCLIHLNV